MSLIELMVAVTIALVMSLAIFSTLSSSEGRKRTLTATNDVAQVGIFSAYQLDKLLRSAGSGFSQGADFTFGCQLTATRTAPGQILPFTAAMAAPFTAMNTSLGGSYRLAPVIIVKDATTPNISGKGSDALIIMSGSAGFGEVPTLFTATGALTQLNLQNTVSFQANDLVLLTDTASATGPAPCMIEQVTSSFLTGGTATALPLAGSTYSGDPINGITLAAYSTVAMATNLGSGTVSNPPSFVIVGVGDNNNLMTYDLLQMGTFNTSEAMADGIFEMHALYGVDTTGNGTVDIWVDPKTAGYDAVTLQSGTTASVSTLRSIKAIRVGLILRTQLPEKATTPSVTPGPLALFSDLGATLKYTRTLATAEQNFRYRTIETTIPLRNVLLLN
ncbi:hypothetical protein GCM10022212_32320 [Actimicrobium antarcticum]|uniref:Prepilin-type N-terminal cleavage/methylation domain-containing protein n=2 Tax=Actimicrobium antarcticum TaxID=1051899 RepID=A0ABP7TU49_9BURK